MHDHPDPRWPGETAGVGDSALWTVCRFSNESDSPSEEEAKEVPTERKSSLTELGLRITSLIMSAKTLVFPPVLCCACRSFGLRLSARIFSQHLSCFQLTKRLAKGTAANLELKNKKSSEMLINCLRLGERCKRSTTVGSHTVILTIWLFSTCISWKGTPFNTRGFHRKAVQPCWTLLWLGNGWCLSSPGPTVCTHKFCFSFASVLVLDVSQPHSTLSP